MKAHKRTREAQVSIQHTGAEIFIIAERCLPAHRLVPIGLRRPGLKAEDETTTRDHGVDVFSEALKQLRMQQCCLGIKTKSKRTASALMI